MFEDKEVFMTNVEDGIPEGSSFGRTPCLTPEELSLVNMALRNDDPTFSVIALEKVESQISFLGSVQARLAAHLDEDNETSPGKPATAKQRGTASQIALARKRSPHASLAYVRRMRFLISDMPYLFSRYQLGDFSEKLIMSILSPLEDVSRSERQEFDRFFADNPSMFDSASTHEAHDIAQKTVDQIRGEERDEEIERKAKHRGVAFFKGKDCINMNVKLPIEVGVAIEDALEHEAQKAKKGGDPRTIKQLKVDILVSKLAGHPADMPLPIKLHVNLVMTDMALLMDGKDPASVSGYGSVPAKYAARLFDSYNELDDHTPTSELDQLRRRIRAFPSIRRLYVLPKGQDLVAMDSKERLFKGSLRKLLELRDPYCRTPYCNNKPRQADHVEQHCKGGKTCSINGCMKCGYCNLAKEAPGWTEKVIQETPHKIKISPPGAVEYESTAPPLIGLARLESKLTEVIETRKVETIPSDSRQFIIRFPDAS